MQRRNFIRTAFGCSLLPAAPTSHALPGWNTNPATIEQLTYNAAFAEKLRWETRFPRITWTAEKITYGPSTLRSDDPSGRLRATVDIRKYGSRGERMWIFAADGDVVRSSVCAARWSVASRRKPE